MTISYQGTINSSAVGGFTGLIFKYRGSLYALIAKELLLFMLSFITLSMSYRNLMNEHQKGLFEKVVKYFDAFLNLIPLSFVLGFYVSYVASRWWQQFLAIPWPDKLFHTISCFIDGFDEEARILRRSLMRYMNLALILVLRSISSAVKQRFPTLEHVVESGFMTNQEKELFQAVPANEFNTYWIPCTWFVFRLQEAAKKGKLLNSYALETIMREFCEFRAKCGLLWCYDWVSIPMVYTQVVTLATYVFFIFTVIGRQKIDMAPNETSMRSGRIPLDIDLYIPVYTILQFFFYMGLLKVAEQLINPFGDDDEDFELNWLVDRHMKASFLGCDILMDPDRIPPMVKDYYWDKQNCPIPYTEASMHFKRKTHTGSAAELIVPESKQHMVLPEIEEEDEDLNQRHSKLSLTSLLLESATVATSPSVGLGSYVSHNPNSSNIVTKIGLGEGLDQGYDRSLARSRLSDVGGNGYLPHTPTPDAANYDTSPTSISQGSRAFGSSWRNSQTPQPSNNYATGTRRNDSEVLNGTGSASYPDRQNPAPSIATTTNRRESDTSLPTIFLGASTESNSNDDEDNNPDRRNSASDRRRGSKLLDIFDGRNKKSPKRYKDKQGFVWRRMVHDNDDFLHSSRTPHLGQGASSLIPGSDSQTSLGTNSSTSPRLNLTQVSELQRKISAISNHNNPNIIPIIEQQQGTSADTTSMTSFKTCPSDPYLSCTHSPGNGSAAVLQAGNGSRQSVVPNTAASSPDSYNNPPGKIPLPQLVPSNNRPPSWPGPGYPVTGSGGTGSSNLPKEQQRKTGTPVPSPPQIIVKSGSTPPDQAQPPGNGGTGSLVPNPQLAETKIQGVKHLVRDRS